MSENILEIDVTYTYKAKIDLNYLESMIGDGLCYAFSKYTIVIGHKKPDNFVGEEPKYISEKIMKGWIYKVRDYEDTSLHGILSFETIKLGIQVMALKYPHLYRDAFLKENYDAISASALLEIATFGEIIYG